MKKLLFFLSFLVCIAGCEKPKDGKPCSIEGKMLVCPDGTSVELPKGDKGDQGETPLKLIHTQDSLLVGGECGNMGPVNYRHYRVLLDDPDNSYYPDLHGWRFEFFYNYRWGQKYPSSGDPECYSSSLRGKMIAITSPYSYHEKWGSRDVCTGLITIKDDVFTEPSYYDGIIMICGTISFKSYVDDSGETKYNVDKMQVRVYEFTSNRPVID